MLATKPWPHSSLDNYTKLANFTLHCQLNKVFLRTYSHNLCYVVAGSQRASILAMAVFVENIDNPVVTLQWQEVYSKISPV